MKCPNCHYSFPTEVGQGRLFAKPNFEGGRKGMEQAYRAADPEWKAMAFAVLNDVALRIAGFTVDDVSRSLKNHSDLITHDDRALGGVMMGGKRLGWIDQRGDYTPSVRDTRHGTHTIIWRSLIYERKHLDCDGGVAAQR